MELLVMQGVVSILDPTGFIPSLIIGLWVRSRAWRLFWVTLVCVAIEVVFYMIIDTRSGSSRSIFLPRWVAIYLVSAVIARIRHRIRRKNEPSEESSERTVGVKLQKLLGSTTKVCAVLLIWALINAGLWIYEGRGASCFWPIDDSGLYCYGASEFFTYVAVPTVSYVAYLLLTHRAKAESSY